MLTEEYLALKEIFEPSVLWHFLPNRIIGTVVSKMGDRKKGYVAPDFDILYPDGSSAQKFFCDELEHFERGDKVIFQLREAPPERRDKHQYLMNAYQVEEVSEEHLFTLAYDFNPAKISSIGHQLENLREEVERQTAAIGQSIQREVSKRAASLDEEKWKIQQEWKKLHEYKSKLERYEDKVATREATVTQEIERRVDEKTKERVVELNEKEVQLLEQIKSIQHQKLFLENKERDIDRTIEKRVKNRKAEIDALEERLQRELQKNAEQTAQIEEEQKQFEGKQKQIVQVLESGRKHLEKDRETFEKAGGPRLLTFLSKLKENADDQIIKPFSDEPLTGNLCSQVEEAFKNHNYFVKREILEQFILSTITAAVSGQFVVLSGPTGVGKTSLVNSFADILGAGKGVVPVHPSWIDPTDLIGFYNPQQQRFQPAPFMDKFLEAAQYSEKNRMYFLTLDEMNLSRVENYAADFLSRMEKARAGEKESELILYSKEIKHQLASEFERLKENGDFASYAFGLNHLQTFPHRMSIPEGLVLFGTINLDETTFHLSPKFLDRSFVINVPFQEFPSEVSEIRNGKSLYQPVVELSLNTFKHLADDATILSPLVDAIWKDFSNWDREYIRPLGIRLGFRFSQQFVKYMKVAKKLNVANEYAAASLFFQAKLLPWISFNENEMAVGYPDEKKTDVLKKWTKNPRLKNYPDTYGLKNALTRILERGATSSIVQYLE